MFYSCLNGMPPCSRRVFIDGRAVFVEPLSDGSFIPPHKLEVNHLALLGGAFGKQGIQQGKYGFESLFGFRIRSPEKKRLFDDDVLLTGSILALYGSSR